MAPTVRPDPAYPGGSSQPRKTVKWRIITERHGKHHLYYLETEENLPGSVVMSHIIGLCDVEAALPTFASHWHWIRRPVINTAVIEGIPDPEAQGPQRVALTSHAIHHGLTECCRDPMGFVSLDAFATLHPEFVVCATLPIAGNEGGLKAMFLRHELTRTGMALVIGLMLLIVVLPGLLVGCLTGRADLGVGVAGAMAAVVGCIKLGDWMRKK
ncbi:hypothetical protein F4859DRAFT_495367 [Xylaria cf. heliscus]|nr:hypothetical protein F4859DRAFT_495367 [Xylaria cf. heliscus]